MTQQTEELQKSFSRKTREKVRAVFLAEMRAAEEVFSELHLDFPRAQNSVWGLVVFCERSAWFYVSPRESMLAYFERKASGMEEPVEQFVNFSGLQSLKFSALPKSRLGLLFPERKRILSASFTGAGGLSLGFELVFTVRADGVLPMLNKALS